MDCPDNQDKPSGSEDSDDYDSECPGASEYFAHRAALRSSAALADPPAVAAQEASSSTCKACDSADPPLGDGRWYAETIPRPGTNAQRHFAEGLFPWTVIPSALVCAAGL